MPDSHLPIDKILSGHQQSLFQALRLLDRSSQHQAHRTSPTEFLQLLVSPESTEFLAANGSSISLAEFLRSQTIHPAAASDNGYIELQFIDLLFKNLWQSLTPHADIHVQVRKLFLVIGIHFLQRPDLTINDEHHYTQLLSRIIEEICIWEPTAGRMGQKLPAQLDQLTLQIAHPEIHSRAEIDQLIANFEATVSAQQQRAQTLENRQIQSELANIDTEKARQSIANFIDLRLAGKPLPGDTALFITSTLLTDLQYLVITQGVESPLLKKWKRLIQILSWAFLPQNTHQQSHKINTLLVPFIEQLDDSFFSEFPSPQDYRIFFDQLVEHFISILQNKSVDCTPFKPFNTAIADDQTVIIDQNIITDLEPHNPGDWFFLTRQQGDTIKAKLLLKDPQKDLLFFSDYTGKIIKRSSFEDFSLALAIKSARPLKRKSLYKNALRKTLLLLEQQYQQIKNREHAQQETEKRKRSSEKARQEAEILTRNDNQTGAQKPMDDSTLQQFESQIASLNTGSWLLLKREASTDQKIRLSVKLKAQDKYIFTDPVGHRVAEYSLAQLVDLMATDRLQIISRVQGFENSLEKIVRQIRSDKS